MQPLDEPCNNLTAAARGINLPTKDDMIRFARINRSAQTEEEFDKTAKVAESIADILAGAKNASKYMFVAFGDTEQKKLRELFKDNKVKVGTYKNGKPLYDLISSEYHARIYGLGNYALANGIAFDASKLFFGTCTQDDETVCDNFADNTKRPRLYVDVSKALA